MRTLLATAILLGCVLVPSAGAEAPKDKRAAKAPAQGSAHRSSVLRESVCEERARAEDPTGQYAAQPCWAREAFGRGSQGGPTQR